MVCFGALALSSLTQPLFWHNDWHVDGMRMWALWLHPGVTTNPARAFSWSGKGVTDGSKGLSPAPRVLGLSENLVPGLGVGAPMTGGTAQ